MRTIGLTLFFLVACDVGGAESVGLEDIGRYHLSAYNAVADFDSGEVVIGNNATLAGEATLSVSRTRNAAEIDATYADVGFEDSARWSGDGTWDILESGGEAYNHTIRGVFLIDGEAVDVDLLLWQEEDGAKLVWMAAGSLGDEQLSNTRLATIRTLEDHSDECRTAVGVDCDSE